MNSLPAKGLARALSVVALAGCALSISVHLIALLGFHSKAILNFQLGLFLGVFVMFVPAYLGQSRLLSEFSSRIRSRLLFDPKFSLANAPKWLRRTLNGIFCYYIAFFALFAYRVFPNHANQVDEILLVSACTAVFYCGFAANLTSYARTERLFRPDEI